jgi:signal transduction histidine kinase
MPASVLVSRFGRLSPTLALAAVIGLVLAGAVVAIYNERSYRVQKAREIGVQAQILASSVTAALVFDDDGAAREYINALAANPEVEAAAVYDGEGTLFAGFVRPRAPPLPTAVAVRAPHRSDERLVVVARVVQADTPVGAVYLRTTTEPMAQRLARYGPTALLIVMASLAVGVLGAAQAALRRANGELAARARDLAATNRELHAQIEEREKAEEALRQSQKMEAIGQLSGGIAHDFNNLLTVVQGNLQLLQKRLGEGRTDVTHYADLAMDGLNRASNLTQRILAFSRRQPLSPKPVDLNRLILDMDGLVRHSLGARISIEASLDADWHVLCDPSQMENVLLNLAINARDAMPEG